MSPYFFFSYARKDQDPFLDRFFEDLVSEVRRRAGLDSSEEAGFRDTRGIGLGESWPEKLLEALGNARVMVCLYTPTYFKREDCGREWALFNERLMASAETGKPTPPPLIIPILWLPVDAPEHLSNVQWTLPGLGTTYSQQGLYSLIRQQNSAQKDEYNKVLEMLAGTIIERAKKYPLGARKFASDYAQVASAFNVSAPLVHTSRSASLSRVADPSGDSRLTGPVSAEIQLSPTALAQDKQPKPGTSRSGSAKLLLLLAALFAAWYFVTHKQPRSPPAPSSSWRPHRR